VDDGYGVELAKAEAAAGHEGLDGRDEALGGGAAGEGRNGEWAGGIGQGNAAGCATGVDEQNLQTVRPHEAGVEVRRTTVQVRSIGKPNPISL
jgi:hypothetical protein